jgi:hypothetical protein
MTLATREEREWLLGNIARAFRDYLGAVGPPVPVEDILHHPPDIYQNDFGVVDMHSNLWDATFARPLSQKGNIFVRKDLPSDKRRFALARETLSAVITSKHGRSLGLMDLFISDLLESGESFAAKMLTPDPMVAAYRKRDGSEDDFAIDFDIPGPVASRRWTETSHLHS